MGRQYDTSPGEEYTYVTDIATSALEYSSVKYSTSYLNTAFSWCGAIGMKNVTLYDSYGDGWGTTSRPSWVDLWVDGIHLLTDTLPYKSGKTQYSKEVMLSTVFDKPKGTEWSYTDTPQNDQTWTTKTFSTSGWSTANGTAFPSSTTTTRYYRTQVTYSGTRDALSTLGVVIRTDAGYILYV
ncbi:hypothetical protein WA158_002707, partial [Blastocystis sp. Blastoise]